MAERVQLTLDSSEADAALVILQKESENVPVSEADWSVLFATAPYKHLKKREAAMHADLTDDAFRTFLSNRETIARTQDLKRTLQAWKQAPLTSIVERVLTYLPEGAQIHAWVYPEIKPAKNSFVWGTGDERAIVLYLNPALTRAQFENKVAHESHHIGLNSLEKEQVVAVSGLSPTQKKAVGWLGAFGEGVAMLAAAGSPDRHPHSEDDEAARKQWDSDMAQFNINLAAVQQFLLDILDGKLTNDSEMEQRADPFYDTQGAWYTVGYRMACEVEKRFGRQTLTEALVDPRKLLVLYNRAAEQNRGRANDLAVWSSELLKKLDAK
ncbi:MAG TPA: DUF5700 domain-containing putative Zn-dependent protease [Terriglobales bacterium]|jgi:hypothetical protein|nr:DUF5700 domain-containing putative Zn-dependent protease [Terriglobales bacterium]